MEILRAHTEWLPRLSCDYTQLNIANQQQRK